MNYDKIHKLYEKKSADILEQILKFEYASSAKYYNDQNNQQIYYYLFFIIRVRLG